ncbi:hypothetical protein ABIC44_002723 [Sphingomonas sp. 1185]
MKRRGIEISVTASDRARLEGIVAARGSPQKHVWRARIVLLSADGLGTVAIMAATGKSKTCVWRWQERFMAEGVDGLLRDKTRPRGITPLETTLVDKVVALTLEPPDHEATHWTVGVSGIWCAGGHKGKEGDPVCPDAKSLRYRMSCLISCWLALMLVPPWRRAACWMR